MQKTKLGISVGLLGAIFFFAGFFGGYLVTILMAGYILLVEDNAWLKRVTVKGVVLMLFFTVLAALINFIPNIVDLIDSLLRIFKNDFYIPVISNIINFILTVLNVTEKVLFLILGFKALKQATIVIPPLDSFVGKYMD